MPHNFGRRDFQGGRQLDDGRQGWNSLSSLQQADIRSVQFTLKAEFFLGQSALPAEFLKDFTEYPRNIRMIRQAVGLAGHSE